MKANRQIQINTDTAASIPQLRLDCRFEKMSFGNSNTNITDMKKNIKTKIAVDLSPGSCLPIIFGILIFYHHQITVKKRFSWCFIFPHNILLIDPIMVLFYLKPICLSMENIHKVCCSLFPGC